MTGGTLTLSGNLGVCNDSNNNPGYISLTGGTLTANSATVGRTEANNGGTIQTAGSATRGIYVNGGTLNITTTLGLGVASNATSSPNMRVDSGSVTVGGQV